MAGIVRGSLDQPPIVVRRRRLRSFLTLLVALTITSCLVWGWWVRALVEAAGLVAGLILLVCIPTVAVCANLIAHPSVLTLSPEGIAQRRSGATRKRRWADITGLVSEEDPEEPDDDVELGVESAAAGTIWLDPIIPADQLEALIRSAQARWAPDVVIGPRRRGARMELIFPSLAAILVLAASIALARHQIRIVLGLGWVSWPWWLTAQAALVVLGFRLPMINRPARSAFQARLANGLILLLLAAMFAAVAVLGLELWSAAIVVLGITHAQLVLFFGWIRWGLIVIGCGVIGLMGLLALQDLVGFIWKVLTRRRAEAR
jgi:hypothetical protein